MILLVLPLVIPLVAAAAGVVAWRSLAAQRAIAVVAAAGLFAAAALLVARVAVDGPVAVAVGGWAPPFAIRLRADLLGALMVLITGLIGLATTVYALADAGPREERHGLWPLTSFLLMGVSGSFLTADLFNLYVWFEVMLMASFVLLALGGTRAQLRGSLVYVVLNLIGSTLFLIAVGLLYAAVRTVDFSELGLRLQVLAGERPGLLLAIQGLLATSFGIKAAVFPLFFWLPASYPAPLPSTAALFAGLLTKVGVYALFRVTAGVFPIDPVVHEVLIVVAIATMATGVAGALAERGLRRILSFHIVSQIGYMVAGLGLVGVAGAAPRLALAAAIFYVLHHIVVKANLFLVAGIVARARGTESLDELGGVARTHPGLAVIFLVSALSLAGVPPLSGFWAKLAVIQASLGAERWALAAAAVVTGLLTLASMLKIWLAVFAGPAPRDPPAPLGRGRALLYAPAIGLAAITLAIGLVPAPLFAAALEAAAQVLPGGDR